MNSQTPLDLLATTTQELLDAAHAGLITGEHPSSVALQPQLIHNDPYSHASVLASILDNLQACHSFWMAVAFITEDGLATLKLTLAELAKRNITGRILTSTYLNFNQPKVLQALVKLPNVEVKVLEGPMHVKGYCFNLGPYQKLIIGSANLTANALKINQEWNMACTSLTAGQLYQDTSTAFNNLWKTASCISEEWLINYTKNFQPEPTNTHSNINSLAWVNPKQLIPNRMQHEALLSLAKLRFDGHQKGLLISATGTGKTYLAAFDVQQVKPKKLLFVAHREQILQQAAKSFQRVLNLLPKDIGLLSSNNKDFNTKYLFTTIQTLAKDDILNNFTPDEFDYIIVDETHRAGAPSYQKILNYFTPNFLLGMTATPERSDNINIYQFFDYQVAYELRLQEALEVNLLAPFHYYALQDITVDNQVIADNTDFALLTHEQRLQHLWEQIDYYGYSGPKVRGLVFCRNIEEAQALAQAFTKHNRPSVALTGANSQEERNCAIHRLTKATSQEDYIDYIFTVDIFNEGIDIPEINQIILLRPTQSPIVFVQQLGRGLRKHPSKDFVTILDFIGNYERCCLIPVALSGDTSYNKDNLRRYVAEGSKFIPGTSTVNFSQVTKQQIYDSLDKIKWNSIQILRQHYQELKAKLGRIPTIADFTKWGAMDISNYFAHKNAYTLAKGAPSYYGFLVRYEPEYEPRLSIVAETVIGYVTQKFAKGKRLEELQILDTLLTKGSCTMEGPKLLVENLIRLFTNSFNTTVNVDKVFKLGELAEVETLLVETPEDIDVSSHSYITATDQRLCCRFTPSPYLTETLDDPVAKQWLKDILTYAQEQYKTKYSKLYQDSPFVLYGKYTYEEIVALLQWKVNIPSLNIGGYKLDNPSKTMPIFINYHTSEHYQPNIKYEHGFSDPSHFVCYSKPKRTLDSPEIVAMEQYPSNDLRFYLFIRKNKEDTQTAKEFYFLGYMEPEYTALATLPNKQAGVAMGFKLTTPVPKELYNYLTIV